MEKPTKEDISKWEKASEAQGKATCELYSQFFNSKCTGESKEIADNYPERAKTICLDFMLKYKNKPRVIGVGNCLVAEEAKCQKYKCCKQRNKCRLDAHAKCYSKYLFIDPFNPFGPGFPDGGPELGWKELFPDWYESIKNCEGGQCSGQH